MDLVRAYDIEHLLKAAISQGELPVVEPGVINMRADGVYARIMTAPAGTIVVG